MWPMNKKWLLCTAWTAASALGLAIILNAWVIQEMLNTKKKAETVLTTKPEAKLVLQEAEKPRMSQELKAIWIVATESETPKQDFRDMEPEAWFMPEAIVENNFQEGELVYVAYEIPGRIWSYVIVSERYSYKKHWKSIAISYLSELYDWDKPEIRQWESWIMLIAQTWTEMFATWQFHIADMKDDKWVFLNLYLKWKLADMKQRSWTKEDM